VQCLAEIRLALLFLGGLLLEVGYFYTNCQSGFVLGLHSSSWICSSVSVFPSSLIIAQVLPRSSM